MTKLIVILVMVTSFTLNLKATSIILDLNLEHQITKNTINEDSLIKKVVEQYFKGLQTRNFALIRGVCITETILYGVRKDSSLNVTTLDQWSKKFNPSKPPFKKLDYKIKKIDFEGTAAQVKILLVVNDKNKIHDFLNLLKIKGKWMIVNIIDF